MHRIEATRVHKTAKGRKALTFDATCPATDWSCRAPFIVDMQHARYDKIVASVHRAAQLEHIARWVRPKSQCHSLRGYFVKAWRVRDTEFDVLVRLLEKEFLLLGLGAPSVAVGVAKRLDLDSVWYFSKTNKCYIVNGVYSTYSCSTPTLTCAPERRCRWQILSESHLFSSVDIPKSLYGIVSKTKNELTTYKILPSNSHLVSQRHELAVDAADTVARTELIDF